MTIYELVGWRAQQDGTGLKSCSDGWLDTSPDDGPSRLYLERIASCRENPPAAAWQGVTAFDHK